MDGQPRDAAQPCRVCGKPQKYSIDLCEACGEQEREAQTMAQLDAYHDAQDEARTMRYVEAIRTANLTLAERRASLSRIEERRALLIAELAQLDAMRQGHLQALGAQGRTEERLLCPN